jgi:hypothetical protein
MAGIIVTKRNTQRGRSLSEQSAEPATSHQNLDWFLANAHALLGKYPDHWLAIRDGKVIDANPSVKALHESLKADARTGYIIVRSKEGSTTVHR